MLLLRKRYYRCLWQKNDVFVILVIAASILLDIRTFIQYVNGEIIVDNDEFEYTSWHRTVGVGGPVQKRYIASSAVTDFTTGLQSLLDVIATIPNGQQLRAYGSRWSVGDIPYNKQNMVHIGNGFDNVQIGLSTEYLEPSCKDKKDYLVFAQSGIRLRELNSLLKENKLVLPVTGFSDGQRLGGAISTGTHGSAIYYGAMQEFVRGIHIVVSSTKNLYLQRQSDPVLNTNSSNIPSFLSNATIINDDDLFNTALVCFGSCGIIHGYLIETEPLFRFRFQSKQISKEEARSIISKYDTFPVFGIEQPYHVTVGVNPYQDGYYAQVIEKIPDDDDTTRNNNNNVKSGPQYAYNEIDRYIDNGFQLPFGFLFDSPFGSTINWLNQRWQNMLSFLEGIIPAFLLRIYYGRGNTNVIPNEFKIGIGQPFDIYPSDLFTGSERSLYDSLGDHALPSFIYEIAVPMDSALDLLDTTLDVLRNNPISTYLAFKFAKQSNATLAFTKYNPTVIMDINSKMDNSFYSSTKHKLEKLAKILDEKNIPHTFHWGKNYPLNTNWVLKSYGTSLTEWQNNRKRLLEDKNAQIMFSSDLLVQLGVL